MHVYNIYGGFYHTITYVFQGILAQSFPWIPNVHCMWHLWARWNKWTNFFISCVFKRKGCLIVLTQHQYSWLSTGFSCSYLALHYIDYLLASFSIVFISSGRIDAAALAKSIEMSIFSHWPDNRLSVFPYKPCPLRAAHGSRRQGD